MRAPTLTVSLVQLAVALELIPDPAAAVDVDGRMVSANEPFERLFGYTREQLVGMSVDELVPSEMRQAHMSHRKGYAEHPRRRPMGSGIELWAVRSDGSRLPVEVSLNPIDTERGPMVVASIHDLTERRGIESSLRRALRSEKEANERLRQLDDAKDMLVRAVSHDVRNPLSAVLGLALMLQRQDLPQEKRDHVLNRIVANAERIDRMLQDLSDLEGASRGRLRADREQVDVGKLAQDAALRQDRSGHTIVVDAEAAHGFVDSPKVERVIENLLSNALKHTPPGTSVWIRARREDDGVLIVVEDSGPGVSDAHKAVIFEPFQRGGSKAPGTGVGLSLVAAFAKLHGGRAWVEDRPGGGATFKVFFPDDDPQLTILSRS